MSRISLTKERAKKLVEIWEAHKVNHTNLQDCFDNYRKCAINKFFIELKKKL